MNEIPYVPILESDLRAIIAIIKGMERSNTEDLTAFRERLQRYLATNPSMSWAQYKAFIETSRATNSH